MKTWTLGPSLHIYLSFNILDSLWMYTLEKKKTFPLCILFTLMPQVIPLLTLMFVHTRCEESNPQAWFQLQRQHLPISSSRSTTSISMLSLLSSMMPWLRMPTNKLIKQMPTNKLNKHLRITYWSPKWPWWLILLASLENSISLAT
jgi:hypothetical protein